jgi:type IV fimbrial biogenesis protein FimT
MLRTRGKMAAGSDQHGFTVIELIVTVSVLAVLMAVAVPTFVEISRSQRLGSQTTALHQDLTLARVEAVKLQQNVLLDAKGGDWTTGWTVFADTNANASLDGGEPILHVQGGLDEGYQMKAANGSGSSKAAIGFNNRGALVGGGGINVVVCAPGWTSAKDKQFARNLRLLASGRAEVGKGKGAGPGLTCR